MSKNYKHYTCPHCQKLGTITPNENTKTLKSAMFDFTCTSCLHNFTQEQLEDVAEYKSSP